MNEACYITIPANKLREAVQIAYEMSAPQGLGFLHARGGPLDDETTDEILARGDDRIAASMDYVHGRSCKFHVYKSADQMLVRPSWYDHSEDALIELLTRLGVTDPQAKIDAAKAAQVAENEKWDRENP